MKLSEPSVEEPTRRRQFLMLHRRESWQPYVAFVALSLVVISLLAALAVTSVNVLGALRAYVGGESLWSKASSDAVQHLRDFAVTHNQADFVAFEEALALPLGDQQAREEMLRSNPNLTVVRQGLIAGGNHPDDVAGMITLFRRFGDRPVLQEALTAWTHGDALLAQLRAEGQRLRHHVNAPADGVMVLASLEEVRELSDELVLAAKRFSASLAQVSRLTEKVLIVSTLSAAVVLALSSFFLLRHALRRQQAHRQALVSANEPWMLAAVVAELGMFEMDVGSDHIMLDAKAACLYGVGSTEMLVSRDQLRQLIVADDLAPVQAAFVSAMQSGQPFKTTYRVRRPDGDVRYVESIGQQMEGASSTQRRLVGVMRDVTDERAQAERAMQRDAAEKVAQSQRNFLSRLSHELRTPLNAILGFAQLLLLDRTNALNPAQTQRVKMMLEAGHQLLSMVEDVLDLTKVDAGEITIALQPVELAPLWRSSAAMIEGVRERHGVSFVDRLTAEPLWVCADPQRLVQVFINLLTNACKYNRPGGHVVVEGWVEDAFVVLELSDDGIGMSADDLAQLFQPFKRLAPMAESIEGTGLGLYIVKQLVERMNGSIQVSSESGQGSRFTLRLPMTSAPVRSPV
ncbi:ATP-binding protein [Aquabacterium sp.]|uniref:sensor histidine kinase n=1 Tax=Aquabacterium sp. TaxID=1872578 RepID=UPI00199E5357|nr:ATP-binding protein [Aquabacterium sp.]MBC7699547.1 PAS domain-containing sensor histidine kinase [Aquabacterium sp.]